MDAGIFEHCQTDYETLHSMIRAVAYKLLGRRPDREILDELIAQGWVIVMEMLPKFDPSRGARVTTYLWSQLNGRLMRFALDLRMRREEVSHAVPNVSTENAFNSGIFDVNPYRMQPDVVFEKTERADAWQYLKSNCEHEIHTYLQAANTKEPLERVHASRCRKRQVARLQARLKILCRDHII